MREERHFKLALHCTLRSDSYSYSIYISLPRFLHTNTLIFLSSCCVLPRFVGEVAVIEH